MKELHVFTSAVNDSGSRVLCISPVAALAAAQYLRNQDQRDPSLVQIGKLNQQDNNKFWWRFNGERCNSYLTDRTEDRTPERSTLERTGCATIAVLHELQLLRIHTVATTFQAGSSTVFQVFHDLCLQFKNHSQFFQMVFQIFLI